MAICGNCGMKVEQDERFCSNCGSSLGEAIPTNKVQKEAYVSRGPLKLSTILFLVLIILGGLSAILFFSGYNFTNGDSLSAGDGTESASDLKPEPESVPEEIDEQQPEPDLNTALEQIRDNVAFVNIETLRMRAGPSTETDILDRLSFGAMVEVLGKKNEWLNIITSNGKEGWVHRHHVVSEEEFNSRYQGLEFESINYRGNSVSNLLSLGEIAIQGDWIYYINYNDGESIYKVHVDGSGRTKLNNDQSFSLNVTGNWIFYSNSSEGYRIYRINTDGQDRTMVNDDWSASLNVVGNWIYYSNVDEYRKIYKIRTDGSERTRVNSDDTSSMNVVDDWIYYKTLQQQNTIFKVRTDGSDHALVHIAEAGIYGSIYVNNGWIYYSDVYDNRLPGNIYKVRVDGSEFSRLTDDKGWRLNFANDYIYYRNISDGMKLYRIGSDGSGREKVSDDSPWDIYIVGNWLCYYDDDGNIVRMRTDGSERLIIN